MPSLAAPPAIAANLIPIRDSSTDTQAHRRIDPRRGALSFSVRDDEHAHCLEVPRQRYPKDARQQLAAFQRSYHEPSPPSTSTGSTYTGRPVLAVHGIHNVSSLEMPLCQMLETGRCEHQRPVQPSTRHTGMVCNSEFRVNDEGLVRLGGIEPPTLGLEVPPLFETFCLCCWTLSSMQSSPVGCARVRTVASRYVPPVTLSVTPRTAHCAAARLRQPGNLPRRRHTLQASASPRLNCSITICALAMGSSTPLKTRAVNGKLLATRAIVE